MRIHSKKNNQNLPSASNFEREPINHKKGFFLFTFPPGPGTRVWLHGTVNAEADPLDPVGQVEKLNSDRSSRDPQAHATFMKTHATL